MSAHYRTDIMKVFVVSVLFAVLGGAACSAVAWPGAIPLSAGVPLAARTFPFSASAVPLAARALPLSASYVQSVIPPQVKAFGYSTSQYINSAPSSLAIGYQPQISYQSYQVPVSHYYQPIQTYRPIVAPAYFPSTSLLYPTLGPAPAPIAPAQPQPEAPQYPPRGDDDSAVVDSAEFPQQDQQTQAPSNEYLPPQNNPAQEPATQQPFPSPLPQQPSFPSPLPEQPSFPSPSQPSFPSPSPPQSFPAGDNSDQGVNDEDTISVESA